MAGIDAGPTVPVPLAEAVEIAARFEADRAYETADRLLSHVLRVAPRDANALHIAGLVAYRLGRWEEALDRIEQAIAFGIDTPLYLRNVCEVYRRLDRLDEALATAQRAVALAPADPLCLHNLALIHYDRLELDSCLARAGEALALNPMLPSAHFARGEAWLLRGDMEPGWEGYEWRFRLPDSPELLPPTDRPHWDGAPFNDGTLMLIADQGFGDVVQFSRYIPWVKARCPRVAVACPSEVAPIIAQIQPDVPLFREWAHCPPYRAYCPLSGLPRLHGTRLDTVPAPVPYLRADPGRAAAWRHRLDGLVPTGFRRVGVVWAGNARHANDHRRSASLQAYAPLAALERTVLISLQKGPPAAQVGRYYGRAPLLNLGAEIADYEDTMALIAALDLMVTVDTSVAHVAAAMGQRVWMLLPYAPDWRWLLDREDSPWYPTMRLFRQSRRRRWDEVVDRVAATMEPIQAGRS